MTYVANADTATLPTDANFAESAVGEFQAIKTKINAMVGLYNNGSPSQTLAGIYTKEAADIAATNASVTALTTVVNNLAVNAGARLGSRAASVSASLSLLYTDVQVQEITPTAVGASVVLPDATTLPYTGNPIFTIANMSTSLGLWVRRFDGTPILYLLPGGVAVLSCGVSTATPRGSWHFTATQGSFIGSNFVMSSVVQAYTPQKPFFLGTNIYIIPLQGKIISIYLSTGAISSVDVSTSATINLTACAMGTSTILCVWFSTNWYACTVSVTNTGGLTVNTIYNTSNNLYAFNNNEIALVSLSSTQACVISGTVSNQAAISAMPVAIASNVVTFGTVSNITGTLGANTYIQADCACAYNATTVFMAFSYTTNGSTWTGGAIAFTIAANAVSATGAIVSLGTAAATNVYGASAFLFNGSAIAVWSQGASTYANACTISGTTITAGGKVSTSVGTIGVSTQANNQLLMQYALSATEVCVWQFWNYSGGSNAIEIWTVSGTTLTVSYTQSLGTVVNGAYIDTLQSTVVAKIYAANSAITSNVRFGQVTTYTAGVSGFTTTTNYIVGSVSLSPVSAQLIATKTGCIDYGSIAFGSNYIDYFSACNDNGTTLGPISLGDVDASTGTQSAYARTECYNLINGLFVAQNSNFYASTILETCYA